MVVRRFGRSPASRGGRVVEVKFCGLTRPEDAAVVGELGAAFAGVIFAGGPRLVSAPRAREILAAVDGSAVRRVGVFGGQAVDEVARTADVASLHVIQLHHGATEDSVGSLRARFDGQIWAVLGVSGASIAAPVLARARALADVVDALVLDTAVAGRSGGTGVVFDWASVAPALAPLRARTRLVVAGGLRPANVADAVRALAPDVVDVSSGVEASPGVKDHGRMREFAAVVAACEAR